jgi:tripartite-type tricarboxylate transporter receptor subunit TctC
VEAVVSGPPPIASLGAAGPIAQIKAGRLRALAVSSARRLPALPDVPTLTELGYPIDDAVWIGLFAPAGTPREVLETLNGAVRKVMERAEVRERFVALGFEPQSAPLAETAQYVRSEIVKWARVVQATGAKAE